MSVWSDAVDTIHGSDDFGEEAIFYAGNRGPGEPVRIVRASPDDMVTLNGNAVRIQTLTFTIRRTECTPVSADSFAVAGEAGRVVVIGAPMLDTEGTEWTVTCRVGGYSRG